MTRPDLSECVVIFDLDGTLVDSAPDLTGALNHVLETEGHEPVNPAKVRSLVGQGARALIERGLEIRGSEMPKGESGDVLIDRFISYYRDHIADHSVLFPGVVECLDVLEGWDATLAICTNKLEALTFPVLHEMGIKDRFAKIIARDSLPEHKPSGLPLHEILERTNRTKGVMIGDTATDLSAARNAGLPCLLATFGYGHVERLLHKKEQRFDHFEALPKLITELING